MPGQNLTREEAAARADLVTAQRLWRACAAGAGMAPAPDSAAGRG